MRNTNSEIMRFNVEDFAEELMNLKGDPEYKDSSDLAWCELTEIAKLPDVIDLPNGDVDFNVWDEDCCVAYLDGKWAVTKDKIFREREIYYFSEEASKAVAKVAADTDWEEVED